LNFGDKVGKISAGMYTVVGEFLWMWMWREDVVVGVGVAGGGVAFADVQPAVENHRGRWQRIQNRVRKMGATRSFTGKARREDRPHK
jgi:hypothetical protein